MPQHGSEDQLQKNKAACDESQTLQPACVSGFNSLGRGEPTSRCEHRQTNHEYEKRLSYAGMHHGYLATDHEHAQATQESLKGDPHECQHAKPPHPNPSFAEPQPGGKNQCQEADDPAKQPVTMFDQKPESSLRPLADPDEPREIPRRRGPNGVRHSDPIGGHQAADKNQRQRRASRQDREAMQPPLLAW
jgi:hypothetical protein